MNLKLAFTPVFLCIFFFATAQQNLQPGLVVTASGDTLRGFIDYKEWHRNPSTVSFSATEVSPAKTYSHKEIVYFEVDGRETYYLYRVRISMDTRVLSYLPEKKDTTNRMEAVFLRLVYAGRDIRLFSFNDESKLRWYVMETGKDKPEELLNSVYRNGSVVFNEREFRVQLKRMASHYAPDDAELGRIIDRSNYGKKSILNICERISGPAVAGSTSGENSPLRFFGGIGLSHNVVSFSGASRYTGSNGSNLSPLIGGGLDIHIVPAVGRLYIRNTVTFTTTNAEFASDGYSLELKQLNFALHSQLHYNFYNTPQFKWFGGAGAGVNISTYPENTQVGEFGTVTEDFLKTEKFWINMTIQSGVSVKNIEISLGYFPKSDITQYLGFGVKSSSWQLRLNYLFNKRTGK